MTARLVRTMCGVLALAVLAGACGSGDGFEPDLGAPAVLASIDGPVALFVHEDQLLLGDAATGRVRAVGSSTAPAPDAVRVVKRRLRGEELAVDREGWLIAADGRIVREDGKEVSAGWAGPVALAVDQRNRLWAIDAGGDGEQARIARGRERNKAKRNRFATRLLKGAQPVAAAADDTEVYVCDAATESVLRFHVGLDDVARRRGTLKDVKCLYDIAVLDDGSIVTATENQVLRYPRR